MKILVVSLFIYELSAYPFYSSLFNPAIRPRNPKSWAPRSPRPPPPARAPRRPPRACPGNPRTRATPAAGSTAALPLEVLQHLTGIVALLQIEHPATHNAVGLLDRGHSIRNCGVSS